MLSEGCVYLEVVTDAAKGSGSGYARTEVIWLL